MALIVPWRWLVLGLRFPISVHVDCGGIGGGGGSIDQVLQWLRLLPLRGIDFGDGLPRSMLDRNDGGGGGGLNLGFLMLLSASDY